ncbi:MAG TPA: dienelactone hydrolase family protein [Segeticoccus sp.]|uniref:dienelactone hydrolase family protein n=1 Tax=Segeticoccus sp. TaxID=2706531 RepID=UPI002D811594|nr:dienelactone hydrolase family protein [Segeticoccus sp.]HET8599078.1 dienelactone hydrolase family protein [Segeticoccus sp.]
MAAQATTVDVPTSDGVADAVFAAPDDGSPHPGVLLYTDAFGLRPQIEQMCARLAEAGYAVLAPNVFYRSGRAPVVELGDLKDGGRSGVFGKLRPHMNALTPPLAMRDADAYLDYLAKDDRVSEGPVGTVGYCMGGALALRTAAHAPARVAAVASFHGGRLATDAEDSPHRGFGSIQAEVYIAHADKDGSMTPEMQRTVAEALGAAGVHHTVELYRGATHGFTMADTAAHDARAEQRHWDALLDLFGRTLR